MPSWGLDLVSELAESTTLDVVRHDFPRKSDEGLNPTQFLAVIQRHIVKNDETLPAEITSTTAGNRRRIDSDEFMSKVGELFKHMDVRGDGEVSWEDFSSFVFQLELLHDGKGVSENEHCFQPYGVHLGLDGNIRSRGVLRLEYLPAPIDKLALIMQHSEVVHLIGQDPLPDGNGKFRVETGGGSGLARISLSLRHNTSYRPHEVNAVHSIPAQDVVITSSSLGPVGPHFLSVWDLPTAEERASEKQFLPLLTSREETPTRQTVVAWAPTLEMLLTGSSGNGALLGWDLKPLKQSAKLWLHDAGITNVHEFIRHTGDEPRLVTASLDGTIAVCAGPTKGTRATSSGGVILQRLQAHERGVAHMAFCLQCSLVLSAGVFENALETTSDVLVWRFDCSQRQLERDFSTYLRGHESQVIGIYFVYNELEVVTGSIDSIFFVWRLPSLVIKQRFARSSGSPLVNQSLSSFALIPKSEGQMSVLVASMLDSVNLELFARVKQRVHEALIKAEFCAYLQIFVTVSPRRVTIWDGTTGEALTTLTSKRLLGDAQADITAFSLDHPGHKLVVGGDSGEIRACFSHSGSLIRRLDPHYGPVNWLSFASRKFDTFVLSIGGDGALHVLDDADEKGYAEPYGETYRRTSSKRALGRRPRRATGEAYVEHLVENGQKLTRATNTPIPFWRERGGKRVRNRKQLRGSLEPHKVEVQGGQRGHSVLLRRVALSWSRSVEDEETGIDDVRARDSSLSRRTRERATANKETAGSVGSTRRKHIIDPKEKRSWEEKDIAAQKATAGRSDNGVTDIHGNNLDTHPVVPLGRIGSQARDTANSPSSTSTAERLAKPEDRTYSLPEGHECVDLTRVSQKTKFAGAARRFVSHSPRDGMLEGEIAPRSKSDNGGDTLFAEPTYDMTACAEDDHLDLIATVATLHGGIKENWSRTKSNGAPGKEFSTLTGRPISSVHLWDAEMMTLFGTLLFPCPGLVLNLANTAITLSLRQNHPDAPVSQPKTVADDSQDASNVEPINNATTDFAPNGGEESASAMDEPKRSKVARQVMSPLRARRRLDRPVLVTALAFLSPYPLLAGASTVGTVALWRVPDCVSVQALILPEDVCSLRRSHWHAANELGENTSREEVEHLTCMTIGRYPTTSAGDEETLDLYVGNERGDVFVAHMSASWLAALSGEAAGHVPCQRRANHNPYRAVRVKLTSKQVENSLSFAIRAQKLKAAQAVPGGSGESAEMGQSSPRCFGRGAMMVDGTYKFAVPSSGFHISWEAHSSAISSVSWIDSPPSLLSASTDGVAKIWAPDGSCLLGQLDINHKRPGRVLSMENQSWNFSPGTTGRDRTKDRANVDVTHVASTGAPIEKENGTQLEEDGDDAVLSPGSSMAAEGDRMRKRRELQEQDRQSRLFPRRGRGGDDETRAPESNRFHTTRKEGISASSNYDVRTEIVEDESKSGFNTNIGGKSMTFEQSENDAGGLENETTAWNNMVRDLRALEERVDVITASRRQKVGSMSARRASWMNRAKHFHGKWWRNNSASWPTRGKTPNRSASEQVLGLAVGYVGVDAGKEMRECVGSYPDTVNAAFLKRSRKQGAVDLVAKAALEAGCPGADLSKRRWQPLPRQSPFRSHISEHLAKCAEEIIACPSPLKSLPDGSRRPDHGGAASFAHGTTKAFACEDNGLPHVAVLAASRGGRLISSGIAVAGNHEGRGYSNKRAIGAAREGLEKAWAKQAFPRENVAMNMKSIGPGQSWTVAWPRNTRKRREPVYQRIGGILPWGLNQTNEPVCSALRGKPALTVFTIGGREIHVNDVGNHSCPCTLASFAPGAGSFSKAQLGCGGIAVTEGSATGAIAGGCFEAATSKAAPSLSSGGRTHLSPPLHVSRKREKKATDQEDTIRRLVHMGLL